MKYNTTPEMTGFQSLGNWLKKLPDQTMGDPCSVCQTGEPYVEFYEYGLARPDDVPVIETLVADLMSRRIASYLEGRSGRIYWRAPLETSIEPNGEIVIRYDENGPDIHFLTGRKCVLDKNWMSVKAYCRLYRSTLPTMQVEPTKAAA